MIRGRSRCQRDRRRKAAGESDEAALRIAFDHRLGHVDGFGDDEAESEGDE